AVRGVAAQLAQAALLELVEQSDQLAAVVAERVGDRSLRLVRSLAKGNQDGVVVWVESDLLVGGHRPLLRREAEPLEQERRRSDELPRQPGDHDRGGAFRTCDSHVK